MVFITDKSEKIVATCTAWWEKDEPLLHWLAVHPSAQKWTGNLLAMEITLQASHDKPRKTSFFTRKLELSPQFSL